MNPNKGDYKVDKKYFYSDVLREFFLSDFVADVMHKSVKVFSTKHPSSSLKTVQFVVHSSQPDVLEVSCQMFYEFIQIVGKTQMNR